MKNEDVEEEVYKWIVDRRNSYRNVTRKAIQQQALKFFEQSGSSQSFVASNGWCDNFMKRFNLSVRRKTHQSQRLPQEVVPKVIAFLKYVRKYYATHEVLPEQCTAMDETCVFLENPSNKTVSITGNFLENHSRYFSMSKIICCNF